MGLARSVLGAVVMVATSGCDVLFAIDPVADGGPIHDARDPDAVTELDGPRIDADIDAPPGDADTVTVDWTTPQLVGGDAAHPFTPLVTVAPTAVLASWSAFIGLEMQPIGMAGTVVTFPRADSSRRYRLVRVAGPTTTELQTARPTVTFAELQLGRDSTSAPKADQFLAFGTPETTQDNSVYVFTKGLWSLTQASDHPPSSRSRLRWIDAQPVAGQSPLGLLDASAGDSLVYLVYRTLGTPAAAQWSAVTRYSEKAVTMAAGSTDTAVPLALVTTNPPKYCSHVHADRTLEELRMSLASASYVPANTGDTSAFAILSVPTAATQVMGALALARVGGDSARSDLTVRYNSFLQASRTVAAMTTTFDRVYRLPASAASEPFHVGTNHYVPITDETTCPTTTVVAATVGIPTKLHVGGMEIGMDGTVVGALDRTVLVPITWNLVAPTVADFYRVTLYELTSKSASTIVTEVRRFITDKSRIDVDPALLVAGHSYAVRVTAVLGLQAREAGDFSTFLPASATADIALPYFTLAP